MKKNENEKITITVSSRPNDMRGWFEEKSSMATDLIKGKTVDEALKLTNKAVVEALEGLPPIKVHCSVLAEQAVKAALAIAAISGERERPFKAEDVARITEGGHKGYLEYREGRKP